MRSVATVGRWSMRHPWWAIGGWLAFVVVAVGAMVATGTEALRGGAVGESGRGYALMDETRSWTPAREYGYVHSDELRADDLPFIVAVTDVKKVMRRQIQGPVSVRFSRDRHAALVVSTVRGFRSLDALRGAVAAAGARHPQGTVEETGDISASTARDDAIARDLRRAELLSVPVTLLILLFAFGAVVAALVPVGLGLTAGAAALRLLGSISQVFPLDDSVKTVVLLIGMAVGVDYALFYVIRSREERHRGLPSHEALELTARTSGRTVLVSGTTVAVAMAAPYVVRSPIFDGIATGTITVVACAVAGSVTVLPAVLELLGPRIDRGRIPYLPHLSTDQTHSRFWPAVIDRVLRRPALSCALSVALLVALALPALGMHVSKPSDNALSAQNEPELATFARVRAALPATSEPAFVVVAGPPERRDAVQRQLERLEKLAVARGISRSPFTVNGGADGRGASLELPLAGTGDNAASRRAIEILRDDLVPATLGRVPGVETAVAGATAEDVDFTRQMKHGVPYVIAFVLVLAFLLLLVAFRSIVVPLKAIALNLLSVGASYGVLVLVFQHSWAERVLGFESDGAIISWLPIFLFVVLFGLS